MTRPSTRPPDIITFLRSLPLFDGVGEASLAALARAASMRQVPRDARVFMQADPSDAFYLVYAGEIAICLDSADGRELVINLVRPGDCFGELALLTGQPRSASAAARRDSTVLAIPRAAFQSVLDREPGLARRLLEILARRLRSSSERESTLAFMDAQARLARIVLQLDSYETDKGYVTISQEELAQRTGLTRQTVAMALGRWRRKGWLVTGRGRIMILAANRLQQLGESATNS